MEYIQTENLRNEVEQSVLAAPVIDIHTHLFAPNFGPLALWGIDEVVTYHYLIAELFRSWNGTPEQFWAMNKTQQADL
ncbi:MAG: glucuronate isomerase, partial [Bryobacteraceae bacterium]|nr:glucuronate isomerase [Bryobacteraceae bacterium]